MRRQRTAVVAIAAIALLVSMFPPAGSIAATPPTIAAISAGGAFTCALTNAGGIKCWGHNSFGQLGDGRTILGEPPVDVQSLASGVARVTAGGFHTCALTSGGGVKCWGKSDYGRLGDGTETDRATPVDVVGLASGVSAIAAGYQHTCAVSSAGGVKCWGDNFGGTLGDGTGVNRLTPVDVVGLASGVIAIAAGRGHSCALRSGGGVTCWGNNSSGSLGDGTGTDRLTPVDVTGLASGVIAIAAGQNHTCALMSDGGVTCWGNNSSGSLGDGTGTDRLTPVNVTGLASGVAAIAAGQNHTCALTTTGGVRCWGHNHFGQLGDGTGTNRLTPVDVVGLASGVAAIATGDTHTCALTTAGGVKCWGANMVGQLGDGTETDRLAPVDVTGLTSGVTALTAGGDHTCALLSGGSVKCWGWDFYGQLGGNAIIQSTTPVDVIFAASQTVALRPSKPAGTIARGTAATFTATVSQLPQARTPAVVRFVVYRKVDGAWRLFSQRTATADWNNRATLRWTFSRAGSWFVKAEARVVAAYGGSGWSPPFRYAVR